MTSPQTHAAFEWIDSQAIASLNATVHEFRHRKTGARHFHIEADETNNVFLVGFRTVPQDSTGVAHILEHTALCGSQRYPVRDPFFMMTRRSLNTFMNAFTSSDWTAYPFASQNRKDYENLLQVYLDAAFFPNLDALDFAQEGHRVELEDADNADGPLVYKGVVFNEMKGAMSSPVRALWDELSSHVFPTTTYHHNSGGDPAVIPELTHEQLVAFHASHYHPTNALFMTFGDIPPHELQERFETLALSRFEALPGHIAVPDEVRLEAPIEVEATYPLSEAEAQGDRTHIVFGWLLGHGGNTEESLTAHLLSGVLLDNSASPLRDALETTGLGSAPSPLCGLDDSGHEMVFACGLEGSSPEHAEAVQKLILDTLQEVADHGVDQQLVESMLHQLELGQREIGGDHYPYGLQLILGCITAAVHGEAPAAALNIDPVLEMLRERITDPDYIPGLVRKWLLDNNHRVRLVFRPDSGLEAKRQADEAARLAVIRDGLGAGELQQIIDRAALLEARQQQVEDADQLPRVGLEDVPAELKEATGRSEKVGGMAADWYAQGTNGLVYEQLIVPLPVLDDKHRDALNLFCDYIGELGSGGRDYRQTQSLQAAVTGGIHASTSIRGAVGNPQQLNGYFVLSGKALARNQAPLAGLMHDTFTTVRFNEHDHLREMVAQSRMSSEQSVTDSGHALAMLAATSGMSPSAALSHRWRGLEGIRRIKALDDSLATPGNIEELAERFVSLREQIATAPRQMLVISEQAEQAAIRETLEQQWSGEGMAASAVTPFAVPFTPGVVKGAWTTTTQVNFCARAYQAVPSTHVDSAPLMVLGGFLRNGFLHRAIREQGGAYGGGASYDADTATLRFYSYRDPRLTETLADFDRSLDWLLSETHEARTVEEAILGVIARIDQPGSPAGEAQRIYFSNLHGRTAELRREMRNAVLGVTIDDLQRVAQTYIVTERASTAVVCGEQSQDEASGLGLEIISL